MGDNRSKTGWTSLFTHYIVVLAAFGSLFFIFPAVADPIALSGSSRFWDWLVVGSILASTWALWLAMIQQRSSRGFGLWRLLGANLAPVSIFFTITAAAFVVSAVKLNIVIPPESNLMNNRNVSLIAIYSRIPILSHPVSLYILITALAYRIVQNAMNFRRGVVVGGLMVFVYYFIMHGCGTLHSELLADLLVKPEETHVLIMFTYWFPTVLFALIAYVAYVTAFRSD